MLNVLIAEAEELEFGYEVIGVVASASEAREFAALDMARRECLLESGGDPGICPFVYKMFQRGLEGYSAVLEISALTLNATSPSIDWDALGRKLRASEFAPPIDIAYSFLIENPEHFGYDKWPAGMPGAAPEELQRAYGIVESEG